MEVDGEEQGYEQQAEKGQELASIKNFFTEGKLEFFQGMAKQRGKQFELRV